MHRTGPTQLVSPKVEVEESPVPRGDSRLSLAIGSGSQPEPKQSGADLAQHSWD